MKVDEIPLEALCPTGTNGARRTRMSPKIRNIKDAESEKITPPRKKLKQARLPFQVLSPDVGLSESVHPANKRKLSEGAGDNKGPKMMKNSMSPSATEIKENLCLDTRENDKPKNALPSHVGVSETKNTIIENICDDIIVLDESDDDTKHVISNNISKGDDTKPRTLSEKESGKDEVKGDDTKPSTLSEKESGKDKVKGDDTNPSTLSEKESDKDEVKGDDTKPSTLSEKESGKDEVKGDATKPSTLSEKESEKDEVKKKNELSDTVAPVLSAEYEQSTEVSTSNESSDVGKNNQNDDTSSSSKTDNMDCSSDHIVNDNDELDSSSLENSTVISEKPSDESNGTKPSRKLTPKQLQKRLESSKRKEERQKLLLEKKRLKQEQIDLKKKEKEQQRLEKDELRKKEVEKLKQEKEKLRQEKEDMKKKEKEEKERKRQAELELKNEEKKAKEEEKRKKEQIEEEAKRKQDKTVAAFTSFFVNKKTETKGICELEQKPVENKNFMPFEVKGDMRLAPVVRSQMSDRELLDSALQMQNSESLYLCELKNSFRRGRTSEKTWPLSDLTDDIVILDEPDKMSDSENIIVDSKSDGSTKLRAKLLLFHENRRPPYWGTWRKKSECIRPTYPFRKDDKFFDYEIDSDDEWEEEEPGESLHGSDDEKESVDDYEIDNDFFVPHGYLSDEENEGQDEKLSPETHKAKLKLMELEFEEEMKHKTERIKPRLLGCIWASNHEDIAGTQLMKLLESRRAVYCDSPIDVLVANATSTPGSPSLQDDLLSITPLQGGIRKTKLPDEAIPDLIRLVHGNTNSCKFLVNEFVAYWKKRSEQPSGSEGQGDVPHSPCVVLTNSSIADKIKEIAKKIICTDEGAVNGPKCWYVAQEVRSSHGLMDLTVPNKSWTYTLQPRRIRESLDSDSSPALSTKSPKVSLITKFTKTMTPEEKLKQLQSIAASKVCSDNNLESSPKTTKSPLITDFTKVLSQEERLKQLHCSNKEVKGNISSPKVNVIPVKKRVPILFSVPREQSTTKLPPNSVGQCRIQQNSTSPLQVNSTSRATGTDSTGTGTVSEKPAPVECIDLSD